MYGSPASQESPFFKLPTRAIHVINRLYSCRIGITLVLCRLLSLGPGSLSGAQHQVPETDSLQLVRVLAHGANSVGEKMPAWMLAPCALSGMIQMVAIPCLHSPWVAANISFPLCLSDWKVQSSIGSPERSKQTFPKFPSGSLKSAHWPSESR